MIILDTNVLSELMRPEPASLVLGWFEAQRPSTLHVTALSHAEMLFGAARMRAGSRRTEIEERIKILFFSVFDGRMLSFGRNEAPAYARIVADLERAGRRIGQMDALIAAIASTHGAMIATRDRDFSGLGLTVVNPWSEP